MAHRYHYLKLLLRNHLSLDEAEYRLCDTRRQGLVCHFMGLGLASAYQPVFRADGKLAGHEALLRPSLGEHGVLAPETAFIEADLSGRLVQFDRLVRTIHLLNHARYFAGDALLFLNVHPRLLANVHGHGRTFERILHYYSVPTSQVVIEVKDMAQTSGTVLANAIANYRDLGYRIAVDEFGSAHASLECVLELRPDIVKLDGLLIQTAERSRNAASDFSRLTELLCSEGIQVGVKGIETAEQLKIARQAGAGLLQGFHLAHPEYAPDARKQTIGNEPPAT